MTREVAIQVTLVVVVNLLAGCHKAQLERDARQECEDLGGMRSWEEWDSHFDCTLVRHRDACRIMVCNDGGCAVEYPNCTSTLTAGVGGHEAPDGWVYDWRLLEEGESGYPSLENTVLLLLVREVAFFGCVQESCYSNEEDHLAAFCSCGGIEGMDRASTRCCVEVEVGTGRSVASAFYPDAYTGGRCGMEFHPVGRNYYRSVHKQPKMNLHRLDRVLLLQ